MTATAGLTSDLQKQVLLLEDDLRIRLQADSERLADWQAEHVEAVERERTSLSWVEWRDDRVTQVAVAWVLTTVFVRFCEDNGLIKPVWIAGPESRRQEALDAQLAFFRTHPEDTDREWLQQSVDYLAGMPSTAALVDSHSALHSVSPSGDAATVLLAFWRRKDDGGALVHDLTDSTLSTRFLGDLYQDLSEYAKKTFALLQTPVFVEEFILDQTLEPALSERPLEGFKLIDPTCGSGHFLLGAFARLLARWDRQAPGLEVQSRVQLALDAIHGVDLNPFAVAISRFRLTLAALQACGLSSLEQAPAFKFHLAAGDSLLHGQDQHSMSFDNFDADSQLSGFAYATEDLALLREVLQPGRYDVVVGNPPYITVADASLKHAYKSRYSTCVKQWTLVVPFMERFFQLARSGNAAGWVGQITANNFMKRDFGVKLIEEFIRQQDVSLVVDTSGVEIPGHETPTVIIVGRRRRPVLQDVKVVLRVGREPRGGNIPGPAWVSMLDHLDNTGWQDEWVSIVDLPRRDLDSHPWVLAGGQSVEVKKRIERSSVTRVKDHARRMGFFGDTHADEAFLLPKDFAVRVGLPQGFRPVLVRGEALRDWTVNSSEVAFLPYASGRIIEFATLPFLARVHWWPLRTSLWNRTAFEGGSYRDAGRAWLEWHQLPRDAGCIAETIAFAFKASHMHALMDDMGKVFNSTSPVIKFSEGTSTELICGVLAVLNSSAASFWLRQVAQHQGGGAEASWSWTFEYSAAVVGNLPLPGVLPSERGRYLDQQAKVLSALSQTSWGADVVPTSESLGNAGSAWGRLRGEMIGSQEELDWEVYRLFGLVDDDLCYQGEDMIELALGERAFELSLARRDASGEEKSVWFTSHGTTPISDIPTHWPVAYRDLVQRRIDLIATNPSIRLLEMPEYKRRWVTDSWQAKQTVALRGWLLDRLEDQRFWFDAQGRPQPRSVALLADEVSRDADLVSVLALWEGRPDVSVSDSLVGLLAGESVPYLAAYRLKDSGLRTREAWLQTWSLQRREDEGEMVGTIPVPPKYTSADFRKASWWQARGKLDVSKERFILYPDAGRETDPTPLLGWAGWDHAQQSLALSLVIGAREADGWDDDRLVPLVAGLAELQPWVEQWHADVDPAYGVSLAAFCREQLTARATQVGKSLEELAAWRPAASTRGRKPKAGVSS